MECEFVNWTQDTVRWRVVVNMVLDIIRISRSLLNGVRYCSVAAGLLQKSYAR